VRAARRQAQTQVALLEEPPGPPAPRPRLAALTALGLVTLLAGGHVFVQSAIDIATRLGVSQRVIGLTVVAVGTSLPELAASLTAARRGQSSLAIGNVVGSNVFNVLLVLGATGLAGARLRGLAPIAMDVGVMLAFTLAAVLVLRAGRRMRRIEGALLVAAYVVYMIVVARE
jgi:cation:H+ antiporter